MPPKINNKSEAVISQLQQVHLFGLRCTTGDVEIFAETLLASLFSHKNPAQLAKQNFRKLLVLPISMNDVVGWLRFPAVKKAVVQFDLRITDGMPLVWLAKLKGITTAGRLYGPTVMKEMVAYGRAYQLKHFFYGGTTEVLQSLVANLNQMAPGFKMAGAYVPPFRELTRKELKQVIAQINRSGADILWIGIGSWRQILLAVELSQLVSVPLVVPVGAAFDFIAGAKSQAPDWMQRIGLEWFYRLVHEPHRLWRRYVLQIPSFIVFSILDLLNYYKPIKTISKFQLNAKQ